MLMKKFFLAMALCVGFSGMAAVFSVGSNDKVNAPSRPDATVVGISPAGDYLLLSTVANKGLQKFDLATSQVQTLTDAAGAGLDAKISQDGNTIVYRETSYTSNHLRKVAVKQLNLATGEQKQLVDPSRDVQGVAVSATSAMVVNKGKLSTKAIGTAKADKSTPMLSIKNRQLMLTRNGKTSVFSPNGKQYSYIWESVSPDGSKALYYVCGVGAFVCDLDGNHVKALGQLRAPVWYDNNTVVGMHDIDDGHSIVSSEIVAATLDGDRQVLTDESVIAMYPQASAASGKIAFSTPAGEAYIINVK